MNETDTYLIERRNGETPIDLTAEQYDTLTDATEDGNFPIKVKPVAR